MPRCIIGKSILKAIGDDIQEVAGPLQACAGHEAGYEAAVRSMKGIMSSMAMAMYLYALAVTPLIRRLRSNERSVKQVWYVDDSTGGGKINPLRGWWQRLSTASPQMGYHPNASKTHLIVKPQFQEEAIKVFKGIGIKVTTEGHKMLGTTIGAISFA